MRAVNILRYLQQNGIPPVRLAAIGFAEYRPVAGNDTPEGRQENRRIEILFRTVR
jgi:chemotaxis protein MotB